MKLKVHTPENTASSKSSKDAATIQCNRSSGVITFSKQACKNLDLQPGVRVAIAQDEETHDCYIQVIGPKGAGFDLRQAGKKDLPAETLCFNNVTIFRMILDAYQKASHAEAPLSATFSISKDINPDADGYFIQTVVPVKIGKPRTQK